MNLAPDDPPLKDDDLKALLASGLPGYQPSEDEVTQCLNDVFQGQGGDPAAPMTLVVPTEPPPLNWQAIDGKLDPMQRQALVAWRDRLQSLIAKLQAEIHDLGSLGKGG
jgi:hypothetical protein